MKEIGVIILNEDNIIEINEYYHEELVKALNIMWTILDVEMKHNIKLPNHLIDEMEKFTENFKFRYFD
jgi:hypothetical protein